MKGSQRLLKGGYSPIPGFFVDVDLSRPARQCSPIIHDDFAAALYPLAEARLRLLGSEIVGLEQGGQASLRIKAILKWLSSTAVAHLGADGTRLIVNALARMPARAL